MSQLRVPVFVPVSRIGGKGWRVGRDGPHLGGMSTKITLSFAAVTVCAALALSACQSSKPAASGSAPNSTSTASAPAGGATDTSSSAAGATGSTGGTGSAGGTGATGATSSAPARGGSSGSASGTASAPNTAKPSGGASSAHDDDSYAYTHLCDPSKLTVQVTRMTDIPTRRLITVRNNGGTSCGLSYYPLVAIGNSQSADQSKDVRPLIPGGLGGPPAYPVYAGKTAYAVLDLNPGGSGSGPATTLTEINVLASQNMPNAATQNFPLGGGSVGTPKLGLYEAGVADAVASMQGANTPQ